MRILLLTILLFGAPLMAAGTEAEPRSDYELTYYLERHGKPRFRAVLQRIVHARTLKDQELALNYLPTPEGRRPSSTSAADGAHCFNTICSRGGLSSSG